MSLQTRIAALISAIGADVKSLYAHAASTVNPHAVTKTQVGLGNVDNTSNATERAATATLTNKSFGNAVTITDNSANPALKITQSGTGNAFVVEDVASDTTPFVIDANGNTSLGALSVFRQQTGSVTFDATPTVGANDGLIWNASASTGYYAWQAGGVDRMRIDSSGTVAVGTGGFTVKADYIPSTTSLVQLGTDILLSSPNHALMGNMYYSGGWKYAGNGSGASIKLAESSDIAVSIQVASNNTGGAGAVAAPNTALAILPDARVRINKATSTAAFNTTFECAGQVLGTGPASALIAFNETIQTSVMLHCASGATDEKQTELLQSADGNFVIRTIGDAYTGVTNGFAMIRGTGTTVDYVQLVNGTFQVQSDGNCLAMSASGGLGYGTGAGGTVTQTTSKTTTFTALNKPTGKLTMMADSMAAGASVDFALPNSLVTVNDLVIALLDASVAGCAQNYILTCTAGNGTIYFNLVNRSASPLAEAVKINFAIIKGSTS